MPKMKKYTVEVSFLPDPESLQFAERLELLVSDKYALGKLLAVAAAETLVLGIRERFMKGLPEALVMHRADKESPAAVRPGKDLERSLRDSMKQLTLAKAGGTRSVIATATQRMTRLSQTYQRKLTGDHTHSRGRKQRRSTYALLVERALEVFAEMTRISLMTADGQTQRIGIGMMPALEAIETPTANRSGHTDSKMKTLWRQLEYGTGVFAEDPSVNPRTKFKEPGGSGLWWWGKKRGQGLLVAGTTPVNALKEGSELFNSKEGKAFAKRVPQLLVGALLGN